MAEDKAAEPEEEQEKKPEEKPEEELSTKKTHTDYFVKEVFDSCFDEYIHKHHKADEKTPSFRTASDLLTYADEVLSIKKKASKKDIEGYVAHIYSIIADYPKDEELKLASLQFAHKVQSTYGIDPKHQWIHIFVKPTTVESLQRHMSLTQKIGLWSIIILTILFIVWQMTQDAPPLQEVILTHEYTVLENHTFFVNKTIQETYEVPINYSDLLERASKVQGQEHTLVGYPVTYITTDEFGIGVTWHALQDDLDQRILLDSVDPLDVDLFPPLGVGTDIMEVSGVLKDRMEGLTIQAIGRMQPGTQPTKGRDKVIEVSEVREVNVTKERKETKLVEPETCNWLFHNC